MILTTPSAPPEAKHRESPGKVVKHLTPSSYFHQCAIKSWRHWFFLISQYLTDPSWPPEINWRPFDVTDNADTASVCPMNPLTYSFDLMSKNLISLSSFPVIMRFRNSLKTTLFGWHLQVSNLISSFIKDISYFDFPFWASKTTNFPYVVNPEMNSLLYHPSQQQVVGVSKLSANISLWWNIFIIFYEGWSED